MTSICLKVTIETFSIKRSHQFSFWEAPTHADIIEFQNFLLQLKNQRPGRKTVGDFSIILILKGIILFLSERVHALLNININFNKSER